MNCPNIFLKYGMCIVNGLFVLIGVALIVVGSVSLTRAPQREMVEEYGFTSIPSLIIFLGVFVTVLFFLGVYGLHKQSYWVLMTFAVLLGTILLMEVIGGIAAYVLRDQTSTIFNKTVTSTFSDAYGHNNTDLQNVWDKIQLDNKCCGMTSPDDYKHISYKNTTTSLAIPQVCCKLQEPAPPCNTTVPANINTEGCEAKIVAAAEDAISLVAKWALLVAVLHLLWIIGSCHMAIQFRRGSYETV